MWAFTGDKEHNETNFPLHDMELIQGTQGL